jgi:oligoribonuclease NrnB/cAMP/cGMP phosphodiesterase (DHH superfamily)
MITKKKSIMCFAHYDLDGAVTYLVTKWAHPGYKIEYMPISGTDMRYDIMQWRLTHNFDDFEKVFFLDLDMSSCQDIIDKENVILIDHHKTHEENMEYVYAKAIVKEYPSACLLAYKVFKKLYNTKFTKKQKILIAYGNDYDSYTNKTKEAKMLNIIFWGTQKSFPTFVENYSKGFVPFTKQQQSIYNIQLKEITKAIQNIKLFRTVFADIDGERRVILATFIDKHINDISDHILNTYNPDMVILINLKSKHVSLRRPANGTMRLNAFAADYLLGGGHEYAAGGALTEDFMNFAKTFKPL